MEYLHKRLTKIYSKNKAIEYYNRAADLLSQPFVKLITEEKLILEITDLIRKATQEGASNMNYNQLMSKIYKARALKAEKYYKFHGTDSIFNHIENLYLKSLDLVPDDLTANYYLGVLYYNTAVKLINTLDKDISIEELEKIQNKCEELFKKSLPYLKKAVGKE